MSENNAFDPSAPEGATAPSSGHYLTRKDAKFIGLATLVLAVGMIPIYLHMREKAFRVTCSKNLGGIMETMILYSTQHDDRFPPAFSENGKGEPDADANGVGYTWISDLYSLKSDRFDFVCPDATPEELTFSASPSGGAPIPSSYGYYAPYASYSSVLVDNQDVVVILSETSNRGANKTYDPKPFDSKYDGMIIGWNNSNDFGNGKNVDTRSVTRLAFPKTESGTSEKGDGRHGDFIYGISSSRVRLNLSPTDMLTEYNPSKYILTGHWQEPVQPGKRKQN